MKAFVCTRYGPPDVLQLTDVEDPAPKSNEVLIRLVAATVTSGDCRVRGSNTPAGFGFMMRLALGNKKPRQPILGSELSGTIEAVGTDVTRFKVGDQVFAFSDFGMGCYAEYKCLPEDGAIALKPAALTLEEAAAMSFAGTTTLHFFRKAKLKEGEKILINGASGGVGTAALQLAKYFGAEVTAVCSGGNAGLVRSLGADKVIDYTKEDFTRNGATYDVIVDTAGTAPYARSKSSLKDGGRLLLVLAGLPQMLAIPWIEMSGNKKIFAGPSSGTSRDLQFLAELADQGKFRPVIDRRYPFDRLVDAHRYVEAGHKKGNVVVTFERKDLT